MKKRFLSLILAVVLTMSLAACGGEKQTTDDSQEPAGEKLVFSLSHPNPSQEEDLFHYMGLQWSKHLEELSGGTMSIEVFGDASLGNEKDSFNMIKDGTLDMGLLGSVSCSGQYTMLQIFDMPYLYMDDQDFIDLLHDDEVLQPLYDGLANDMNMHCFGLVNGGFRKLIGAGEVPEKLEDFKDLKVRVSDNAVLNMMWTLLGATPANVPYAECFTAHQQRVIDCAEWPMGVINSNGYYEVCDYVQSHDIYRLTLLPLINNDLWNSLTEEQQGWMTEAYMLAREEQIELIDTQNEEFIDKWAEAGCQYYDTADKEAIAEALEPVWDEFRDNMGGEFVDSVRAKVAEFHAAHS